MCHSICRGGQNSARSLVWPIQRQLHINSSMLLPFKCPSNLVLGPSILPAEKSTLWLFELILRAETTKGKKVRRIGTLATILVRSGAKTNLGLLDVSMTSRADK